MPDRRLHHRAHDRGHARGLGDRERGAHTAQRLLLQHDHVGGVERAQLARRRRASGCTRRPRSARRRAVAPRRARRASRTGCSTYSRSNAASRVIIATAVSTSHAPLASTRTPTLGADRVAHRAHQRDARGVAHLHLHRGEAAHVAAPGTGRRPARSPAPSRARAGGKPTRRGLLGRGPTPRGRSGSRAAASTRPSPPAPRAGSPRGRRCGARCSFRRGTAPRSPAPPRPLRPSRSPPAPAPATAGRCG